LVIIFNLYHGSTGNNATINPIYPHICRESDDIIERKGFYLKGQYMLGWKMVDDRSDMDSFVRSKLGIGLPRRSDELKDPIDTEVHQRSLELETSKGLISDDLAQNDKAYLETVLEEFDNDLDSMISSIDEYRSFLKKEINK
jgi:hypothetical protein